MLAEMAMYYWVMVTRAVFIGLSSFAILKIKLMQNISNKLNT